MAESLKRKIRSGQPAYGTFVFEFFEPGLPMMAKQAGAEFIVWDMEHSGVSFERLKPLMLLSRSVGVCPLVRVPQLERHFITTALDIGAQGIIIPMLETPEQMQQAIRYGKYAPAGNRGSAFGLAHDDFVRGPVAGKMAASNDATLLIPLIESKAGIDNADAIACLEEVDCLWLGPLDLSHSLGIPGDYAHPLFQGAVARVADACRKTGKAFGVICDETNIENWRSMGAGLFSYSTDLWLFQQALEQGIGRLKKTIGENS